VNPDRGTVLLLGGPGSGKGTQGALLSQVLGVPHVSSGELVRQRGSDTSVARGELVPDRDIAELVLNRLDQPDAMQGVILDGFPRTLTQVHLLDEWLKRRGRAAPIAVYLDVPVDELLARLQQRRQDRPDDDPESAMHRIDLYAREMPPLLDESERRGALRRIDAAAPVTAVHERIMRAL